MLINQFKLLERKIFLQILDIKKEEELILISKMFFIKNPNDIMLLVQIYLQCIFLQEMKIFLHIEIIIIIMLVIIKTLINMVEFQWRK